EFGVQYGNYVNPGRTMMIRTLLDEHNVLLPAPTNIKDNQARQHKRHRLKTCVSSLSTGPARGPSTACPPRKYVSKIGYRIQVPQTAPRPLLDDASNDVAVLHFMKNQS
ncbi:unnamed protein product, partial [Ectocarpus sp. 12 AP-2014]